MNSRSFGGIIALIVVIGLAGLRFYARTQSSQQNEAKEQASYQSHADKMQAVLASVASNPKLKEPAKDLQINAKYIDTIFPTAHDKAWDAAVSHGRYGSFSVDEYLYMDGFFKALAAQALADHKNELSAAIEKINLYTAKTDTSDWKPLPGSAGQPPRRP